MSKEKHHSLLHVYMYVYMLSEKLKTRVLTVSDVMSVNIMSESMKTLKKIKNTESHTRDHDNTVEMMLLNLHREMHVYFDSDNSKLYDSLLVMWCEWMLNPSTTASRFTHEQLHFLLPFLAYLEIGSLSTSSSVIRKLKQEISSKLMDQASIIPLLCRCLPKLPSHAVKRMANAICDKTIR